MKKIYTIIFFVALLVGVFLIFQSKEGSLKIGDKKIHLLEAITPEEKENGLGGRSSLAQDSAMIFVFEEPDLYEIWMKGMLFSLDALWLDENYKIVHLEENISPDTLPNTYGPETPSLFVIEANAGFIKENNLQVGNVLDITLN